MGTRVKYTAALALQLFLLLSLVGPKQAFSAPWWKNPFRGKTPSGEVPPTLKRVDSGGIVPPVCRNSNSIFTAPPTKILKFVFDPEIFAKTAAQLLPDPGEKTVSLHQDANGNWLKGKLPPGTLNGAEITLTNNLSHHQGTERAIDASTHVLYKVVKDGHETVNTGMVARELNMDKKELVLDSAFLQSLQYNGTCVGQRIPNKLKLVTDSGELPALAADGNPTVLIITLAQVKAMMEKFSLQTELAPPDLKTIRVSHLQNIDALAEMFQKRKEGCQIGTEEEILSSLYHQTDAFLYIRTLASQLGYKVGEVKVDMKYKPENSLLELLRARVGALNPAITPGDILNFLKNDCSSTKKDSVPADLDPLNWKKQEALANENTTSFNDKPTVREQAKKNLRIILELQQFKQLLMDKRNLCAEDLTTKMYISFDVIVALEKIADSN